jgi:hypothetical protein
MGLGMMICFRLKVETIIIPFRLIPIFLCFNLVQSPKTVLHNSKITYTDFVLDHLN